MTWRIGWSARAGNDLQKLSIAVADRIVAKMDWYVVQDDPFKFAKRLTGLTLGTYRFRVGDYRLLCDVHHGQISVLEVLAVRHRKVAYRE
jgi:mRNA interferase RelE/StbE